MSKIIAYVQAGGFGTRLAPLFHQPGMNSLKVLSPNGRNLLPLNHNSYYSVAKPVAPYFGVALSEPLLRRAVMAGAKDIRLTIHNMPETVIRYYRGRELGNGVHTKKFLYEHIPLDTSGGIVRDTIADMRDGTIAPEDTILILGGDIRTNINIEDFLAEHSAKHADISILLAGVPREEMYRFGAALREGDTTPDLGTITMKIEQKGQEEAKEFKIYGELQLNPDKMVKIIKFFEKAPKLDPAKVENPGELDIQKILEKHGVGALSPTTLQNGSVYAIRAELIEHLAPLVFNLEREASSTVWREAEDINISGSSKFSDFGGDWFMVLTKSKPFPMVNPYSPTAELQQRIIEDLQSAPPQIFGYKLNGKWSDDGTLSAVLNGHFELLDELLVSGQESSWPINWAKVRHGYPRGVITMSDFQHVIKDITLNPPVFIGSDVMIHAGAEIGPYAIINRGWEISGKVERSILFPKKQVDREIEGTRGWKRFHVPSGRRIIDSLVGSGFELSAIDHNGHDISLNEIINAVVVSNGSQNVLSPIDI